MIRLGPWVLTHEDNVCDMRHFADNVRAGMDATRTHRTAVEILDREVARARARYTQRHWWRRLRKRLTGVGG